MLDRTYSLFSLYLSACLLIALITFCSGCVGGSSTAPAIDIAGGQSPTKVVQGSGEKPVSVPDASPREGGVPLLVHFWDGGSYDPDGEIVRWFWNFGDASGGDPGWHEYTDSEGEAWHEYTSPGTKVAHLWVYDNDGNHDVATVKIEMKQGNNANPVAVAFADPKSGNAPLAVNFSAADSYDPDGTIVKFEWDFGEGEGYENFTGTEGVASNEYTAEGTYAAILQVTDDDGAQSMASVEIVVDPPADRRGDWWMFGREPTHNRRSPFAGPTTNALDWYCDLDWEAHASPSIDADGTLYIGGYGGYLYSYYFVGSFYAIDKYGNRIWTYTTDSAIFDSAAIGFDGTIYVGSYNGKIHAINPDDGTPLGGNWPFATGGNIGSSPVIGTDGTIYVGSSDGKVYAINPDGTPVGGSWPFTTGASVSSSPAIGTDGTIYVGSHDHMLYAINPDGTARGENWPYATGGVVHSSPAISTDGTIYVGSNDGKVHAVLPDGTPLGGNWPIVTGGIVRSSPAIGADGTVYVGSYDSKLYAILADGTIKWTFPTGNYIDSSPAIDAEGTIYVGGAYYDGHLYAINNVDGTLKWSYRAAGTVSSPVIGSDGTIYIGGIYAKYPTGDTYSKILAIGPGEGI